MFIAVNTCSLLVMVRLTDILSTCLLRSLGDTTHVWQNAKLQDAKILGANFQ